jgi:hypothetical protein
MPDEPNKSRDGKALLAVPGVLCVMPTTPGTNVLHLGPAAGWMAPRGLVGWEHELSFVAHADMTRELAKTLRATLPNEQIAPKRFPLAAKAAELSPLLPLAGNLVDAARAEGVRVHTVGVDRVSADFFYFAEGGSGKPLEVQGNLIEMVAPSVSASATNADIDALLVNLIDRLLVALSEGVVSELSVELADALPRLSRDGTGLVGTDLEAFENQARALSDASARWASAAHQLADALAAATRLGQARARVPLFDEARQETAPPLEVSLKGKPLRLSAWPRWTTVGTPRMQVEAASTKASPNAEATPAVVTSRADKKPSEVAVQPVSKGAEAVSAKKAPSGSETAPSTPAKPPAAAAVAQVNSPASSPLPKERGVTTESTSAQREAGHGRGSAKSPSVALMLLLAFATSMYFLWRSLE